jgi:hypothetical protein
VREGHPWLRGVERAYAVVCPVCRRVSETAKADPRGTLYIHAQRDYPCRVEHGRNAVGNVSAETLNEILLRTWRYEGGESPV